MTKGNIQGKIGKTSGLRLWAIRLFVLVIVPLILLGLLEIGLRLFGYGFNPSPLVPFNWNGQQAFCDNPYFTWRFFAREIAREFDPFIFFENKKADTYRIFILGSSAAQGVPDGAFAFGRILHVMLRETYPDLSFEVINTALTAVNSHVVRPLAEECLKHQSDLLIVYMGNNEILGPYGPGTVFTPFYSSLTLVRLNMILKTLRLGQLLNQLIRALRDDKKGQAVWRGMEMFLQNQIPFDAPQLQSVYRNFSTNLSDIARQAVIHNTKVIFCTVATNLKDCPPFASLHRNDLITDRQVQWENSYYQGTECENGANYRNAISHYRSALEIDDHYADLYFRLGHCLYLSADYENARQAFLQARNLDTLRFRADGEINNRIRLSAAGQESKGIYLNDIEKQFWEESNQGIPGQDLFLDHVHMNFKGNYIIARALFEQIKTWLNSRTNKNSSSALPIPSMETCAERLAFSEWERYRMAEEMLEAYIKKPPFTNQIYHSEQVSRLESELRNMRAGLSNEVVKKSADRYLRAIARSPGDWWLHWKFALFLYLDQKNYKEAAIHFLRVQELLPHSPRGYTGATIVLPYLGDGDGAIAAGLKARDLNPDQAEIHNNLGVAYLTKKWSDQAELEFKQAMAIQPHYVPAYTNLASTYTRNNRLAEAVEVCRQGLSLVADSIELRLLLADLLDRLGERDQAIAELKEAQRRDPKSEPVNQKLNDLLWEKIMKKEP